MDWKEAQDDLWNVADKLDRIAHLLRKKPFLHDRVMAIKASSVAERCRRLSERRLTVPSGLDDLPREEVLMRLYRVVRAEAEIVLSSVE